MTIEERPLALAGHQLHRIILRPDIPSVGSLIFFHGQGDHIDRYPPILEPFVQRGVTCILTDLPGHGRSSGKRGHVPGFDFIDDLLQDSLQTLPAPHFIAGHSMGGMLALRAHLLHPKTFQAAWFSSPLLDPARQGGSLIRTALPLVASLFPWITWSTGVTSQACNPDGRGEKDPDALYHSKINLGWAKQLVEFSRELEPMLLKLPPHIKTLFTQGLDDPVCPPELLKSRLKKLPLSTSNITHLEIPNAYHEPFSGENLTPFQNLLNYWMDH